jgi:hypothetical protein
LSIFNEENVRYLIVGGYALMLYTEPRFTKDLDLWVEPSKDNAARVFRSLARFGAPLQNVTAEDFATKDTFYQIGQPPIRVDVMTGITGVEFEEAWQRRRQSQLAGESVAFLSREDLIRNKRAVGRLRDLADVESLEHE